MSERAIVTLSIIFALCSWVFLLKEVGAAPQSPHPEREQIVLKQIRDIESKSHLGRIRILQEAEDCIQRAQSLPAYRACEQRENQQREALREETRREREAFRARIAAERERMATVAR